MEDLLNDLNAIFRDIFEDNSIVLSHETTANDIEEWDSLNHIQLILAIEKFYKFKFTSREILSWKNVGEMCESIHQKLEA